LFIAYIGLSGDPAKGAGLIVANEATKTAFGNSGNQLPNGDRGSFNHVSVCSAARQRGFTVWDFRNGSTCLDSGRCSPQGIFALPQIPLDLFGQAITGLSYLNASNFVDWLAVLFVFFVC